MGVKTFIMISAMVSLAFGYNCDNDMDVAACGSVLSSFSGDMEHLGQYCLDADAAVVCVDTVIAECPNLAASQTANYIRMVRQQLSSLCPAAGGAAPSDTRCAPGYMRRIMDCARGLQSLGPNPSREGCRQATASLECLEQEFTSCSDKQEVQSMAAMIDPAGMRAMLGNCGMKK